MLETLADVRVINLPNRAAPRSHLFRRMAILLGYSLHPLAWVGATSKPATPATQHLQSREMSQITLSDGQIVESSRITRVTVFTGDDPRILIELNNGDPVRVFGPGVEADAALLDDVRDREKLRYLVHGSPK